MWRAYLAVNVYAVLTAFHHLRHGTIVNVYVNFVKAHSTRYVTAQGPDWVSGSPCSGVTHYRANGEWMTT
jgi:hypothetical protein